jgi:predicted nucleic acid-binding protein
VTTIIKPAEPDNRILECVKDPKAALIVTGDKHLLAMKKFDCIGTARTAGFLYIFGPEDKFRR